MIHDIQILKGKELANIENIHDVYEDNLRIYVITEKVELRNKRPIFEELLARIIYSENDVAKVIKSVLMALKFCHENHLSHINLRPETILLEVNNGYDKIKLTELGTCQIYDTSKKGS